MAIEGYQRAMDDARSFADNVRAKYDLNGVVILPTDGTFVDDLANMLEAAYQKGKAAYASEIDNLLGDWEYEELPAVRMDD